MKAILGNQFITQDVEMDTTEGTDFAVVTIKPFKVGIRLRRFNQWLQPGYREQFTIRWSLPTGNETEIQIMKGFVRYILYGFVDENEKHIIQYFIGDLFIFRMNEPKPLHIFPNKEAGGSMLAVYAISQFPKSFIVKSWMRNHA